MQATAYIMLELIESKPKLLFSKLHCLNGLCNF